MKTMIEQILHLHTQAMKTVERAFQLRLKGDCKRYTESIKEAFNLEKEAINIAKIHYPIGEQIELLHKSAISLAEECEEFDESENLKKYVREYLS